MSDINIIEQAKMISSNPGVFDDPPLFEGFSDRVTFVKSKYFVHTPLFST
jgi:hypothetical protein